MILIMFICLTGGSVSAEAASDLSSHQFAADEAPLIAIVDSYY